MRTPLRPWHTPRQTSKSGETESIDLHPAGGWRDGNRLEGPTAKHTTKYLMMRA